MNTSKPEHNFCIIGCGRLGISLAVFLSGRGFKPISFCSRGPDSAKHAAAMAGTGIVYEDPVKAAAACDLVFITTPDTRIGPVCEKIAKGGGFTKDSVVFHLSGALSSDVLGAAQKVGAATGSIHPLQSFAPYEKGQASPFLGINISLEGEVRAVTLGRKIVDVLGAGSFTIPTQAKTLYHAAAVVASNYLVTLEHFALSLLKETGLAEGEAYTILEPLIQGTLSNIKARGSINALTGPVARGDDGIIASHLEDIDRKMPQFSCLYRLLGAHTLEIAKLRGDLDPKVQEKLALLFKNTGV
ncbi:MAG: DUF2520 domain-containing protein [Proteobacteria bacterium]|nr:DUF2520 domain-containing protein [Desulfobacula sp.]MBU4133301.1 DUF2520 domain-containing protein [Pseudomonadota bacterium]